GRRLAAGAFLAVPGAAAARGGAEPGPDLAGRRPDRLQRGNRQGNGQDGVLRHGASPVDQRPAPPFPVHHAMLVTYQGKLWLIGGFLPSGPNLEAAVSNRVLFLDPAKQRWVAGPSLHHARAAGAAAVVGNKIIVVGGGARGQVPGGGQNPRDLHGKNRAGPPPPPPPAAPPARPAHRTRPAPTRRAP